MKKYIAVDIGGTAIKYGIINSEGVITSEYKTDTQAEKGGKEILKKVLNIVKELKENEIISGVCISTAGMVDVATGEIFYSGPSIPDYKGTNFKKEIENTFGIPCEVENDVNCAGLAEYTSGAAKGASPALILTVGTGIGGCAIVDGKVFRGFNGCACEIGYMNMWGTTFQKLGAASVLCKKTAGLKGGTEKEWCGYRVFEAAKNGDKDCIQAIDEMIDILGQGIANICYVLNPETVVLGGGIMGQKEYLKDKTEKSIKKYLVSALSENLRVEFAFHKNNAGMLGAYYNFINLRGV